MQDFRNWAFGVCTAAVACGMMQLLLPKSGMQKILNVAVSVFFLGCLLSPVLLTLPQTDTGGASAELQSEITRRSEELASELRDSGEQLATGTLRQTAKQVLEELGVENGKIYINVHDLPEGGISISECEVQLPPQYETRHDEIRAALMQRLGVNVLIGYDPKT